MKKIFSKYILYFLLVVCGVLLIFLIFSGKLNNRVSEFFEGIENRTFDLRQEIVSNKKEPNKDIVIVTIDDNTYEYVLENFGEWPMPRYIYADIVNYIEAQNPKTVAFDLLFTKSIKSQASDDKKLSELFKEYDNLYTAMLFDDMKPELRNPSLINSELSVKVDNKKGVDIFELPNRQPLLQEIIDNTINIGHANFQRSKDGVVRDMIPFVYYSKQKAYFPHLALLVGQNQINSNTKSFTVDKDLMLKFDKNAFPVTQNGKIFLNWYKKKENLNEETVIYDCVSIIDVINAIKLKQQGEPSEFDNYFKDKIVYIGSTATALGDLKTVPVEKFMPGVEIHATFVNNMMDNSFIKRLSFESDLCLTLLLCILLTSVMLIIEYSSINYKYLVPINTVVLFVFLALLYLFAIWVMLAYNLWIALVMPTVGIIFTFILVYTVRYFFKSQDYEYTYRLATTDGLTELYNHRYFQEQMISCIEKSKKSGKKFSIILTDIDFFKKFNDTYGHQAGDAVLRQVARTLKRRVKRTDYVCRYGGEEMSVILVNADKQKALNVAQRLCKAVSEHKCKLSEDLETTVTISLGVSTYPDDGSTPTELIEYSDKGLYFAKENGRNQVGIIDEEPKK